MALVSYGLNATALLTIPLSSTPPTDGQVLTYSSSSGKWRPAAGGGGGLPANFVVSGNTTSPQWFCGPTAQLMVNAGGGIGGFGIGSTDNLSTDSLFVALVSGNAGGSSGQVEISSGNAACGSSGGITIFTGGSASGAGQISLTAGESGAGNVGPAINITSGSTTDASALPGNINLIGGQNNSGVKGIIDCHDILRTDSGKQDTGIQVITISAAIGINIHKILLNAVSGAVALTLPAGVEGQTYNIGATAAYTGGTAVVSLVPSGTDTVDTAITAALSGQQTGTIPTISITFHSGVWYLL